MLIRHADTSAYKPVISYNYPARQIAEPVSYNTQLAGGGVGSVYHNHTGNTHTHNEPNTGIVDTPRERAILPAYV